MSQEGLIDIIGTHPEIPTEFIADVGTAVPIANQLEVLGTVVAAAGVPFESVASGNTVTYQVQYASAIAATDATDVGLAAFNSTDFSVDANGFVSLNASTQTQLGVDAFTAPGTNPVVPNGSDIITITGAQVAAGTIANIIRTDSLAANTLTIEIQRSSAQAATTIGANGVSHFNSTQFSVDANGFVALAGGGIAIDSIGTQTGTNPIVATSAGLVTINGAVVAAGTNPVRSDGTGANTMAIEVQISQAVAGTDATRIGLSNFSSSHFAVDANGFVTLAGGGQAIDSFIPDSGTSPVVPASDGSVTMSGSGSTTTVGGLNSLTFQLTGLTNHNVLIGAGTTTITKVPPSATSGVPLISQGAAADPAFGTAVVAGGGTGVTSFTAYAPVCGGTTTTGVLQSASTGFGTSGFVLTSNGSAALPSFQAASDSTAIKTITGNSGGAQSPSAGNFNIVGTGSITTVGTANTETIQLTGLTNHALQVGAGTATLTQLAVGATGTVLIGNTGADPSFSATPAVTSITLGGGTAFANYLQGTFTPGLSFGGGTTGITYNNQTGVYTRIGNVVHFYLIVGITSNGSSTGTALITGLPIAVSGAGQFCRVTNGGGLTYPVGTTDAVINFNNGATTATLQGIRTISGPVNVTDVEIADSTTIYAEGIYFV